MSKPTFVYVIYIASTPEKVWHALTDEATAQRYWFGYGVSSDWKVGSSFALRKDGKVTDTGVVLESDPPRRLSYSWHPEYEEMKHERPSRVVFTLEPVNGQVKLTMVHDDFDDGSKVFESISDGWPMVLSSLKSFLERGAGLPPAWNENHLEIIAAAEARS